MTLAAKQVTLVGCWAHTDASQSPTCCKLWWKPQHALLMSQRCCSLRILRSRRVPKAVGGVVLSKAQHRAAQHSRLTRRGLSMSHIHRRCCGLLRADAGSDTRLVHILAAAASESASSSPLRGGRCSTGERHRAHAWSSTQQQRREHQQQVEEEQLCWRRHAAQSLHSVPRGIRVSSSRVFVCGDRGGDGASTHNSYSFVQIPVSHNCKRHPSCSLQARARL